MPDGTLVHGTCVEIAGAGVLIVGPPGCGKSDLALRLIDQPGRGIGARERTARLLADDQVVVQREGDVLIASPPSTIAGKMEIRGLGIAELEHAARAPLKLCVRLTDAARIERMPDLETQRFTCLGLSIPEVLIDPILPAAAARVRAALDYLGIN